VAYRTRLTLINKTGKDMITYLAQHYPDITWYLTLKDTREICVGFKDNQPVVVGSDLETILDNLECR
jgi:hypothetical protein